MSFLTASQKQILTILQNTVNSAFPIEVHFVGDNNSSHQHWHKHWELSLQSKNDNDKFDLLLITPPGKKHQSMSIKDMQHRLVLGIGKSLLDCSCFSESAICSDEYSEEGDLVCSHLEQLERWVLSNAPERLVRIHAKSLLVGIETLLDRSFHAEINQQSRSPLEIAIRYIRINSSKCDLTVAEVARQAGCSGEQLCRLFHKKYNAKVREYIINIRLLEAMKLLSENNLTSARVARLSGWSSPHYFSRVFKQKVGITAGEFSAKCRILYPKKERYLDILQENSPELLNFLDIINS